MGLIRTAAVGTLGSRENTAGREDEYMAVRELLFELAGEALLDFMEAGEEGYGDEDYDSFFAVADFDLEEEVGMLVGKLA